MTNKANAFAGRDSGSQGRILVVSDEPNIRRALRIALVASGYEVTDTGTAEVPLKLRAPTEPDLVLLDNDISDNTGMETCRQIRNSCGAAIIVMGGGNLEETRARAFQAGADDHIGKPFGFPKIMAFIRANMVRGRTLSLVQAGTSLH